MDDFSKIYKKEGDGLNLNFKQEKYGHLFKLELELYIYKNLGHVIFIIDILHYRPRQYLFIYF